MSRVVVVIPTYNEIENLPLLVPKVLEQDPRIELLIVDDDSPDGTGKLADDLARGSPRVHVLHRSEKQGLGPAYRAGLRRALDLGADIVVQMDADFSHPPEVLPTLLAEIERHDVVLGSRYLNGITVVNWPIERILISWFGNWYARMVTRTADQRHHRRLPLHPARAARARRASSGSAPTATPSRSSSTTGS